MKAIILTGGKQYAVEEKSVIYVEKLDAEEGKKVTFDKVILVSDEKGVKVGNPYVKGVKVEGKVVAQGKGKKIIVFKMKPKKNERKKQGHRQPYTKVEITAIKTATAKAEKPAEKAEGTEKKVTEKKVAEKKTTESKTTAKKTTKKVEA